MEHIEERSIFIQNDYGRISDINVVFYAILKQKWVDQGVYEKVYDVVVQTIKGHLVYIKKLLIIRSFLEEFQESSNNRVILKRQEFKIFCGQYEEQTITDQDKDFMSQLQGLQIFDQDFEQFLIKKSKQDLGTEFGQQAL